MFPVLEIALAYILQETELEAKIKILMFPKSVLYVFFFIPALQQVHQLLLLFSSSFVSYSLRSHGLPHTRLPCPSPSPGACSNTRPLSQWCHPISSSSVTLFSSCLQSFPASGSFPMSQLFTSGGQNTHWTIHFKIFEMVHLMLCLFYHNKKNKN